MVAARFASGTAAASFFSTSGTDLPAAAAAGLTDARLTAAELAAAELAASSKE